VHVEWLLQLVIEVFSLLLLLKILLLKEIDFTFQVWDASSFELRYNQLSLKLRDLLSDVENIVQLLLVVDLSLLKCRLLDLNLLIEKSKLLISLDELGSENISFVDDHLIVLSLLLLLTLGL